MQSVSALNRRGYTAPSYMHVGEDHLLCLISSSYTSAHLLFLNRLLLPGFKLTRLIPMSKPEPFSVRKLQLAAVAIVFVCSYTRSHHVTLPVHWNQNAVIFPLMLLDNCHDVTLALADSVCRAMAYLSMSSSTSLVVLMWFGSRLIHLQGDRTHTVRL